MIRNLAVTLLALGACLAGLRAEPPASVRENASAQPHAFQRAATGQIRRAAAQYHQGSYDSAFATLQALDGQGPWKRRDSLAWLQYAGMASAHLGRDSAAAAYFTGLLAKDSLFQFPRNEDEVVLAAYGQAQAARAKASPSDREDSIPSDSDSASASASGIVTSGLPTGSAPTAVTSGLPQTATASHALGAAADAPSNAANPQLAAATLPPPSLALGLPDAAAGNAASASGPRNPFAPAQRHVGFAYGALPLGAGWMARGKTKSGLAFGLFQAGGIAVSLFASEMQTRTRTQGYGLQNRNDLSSVEAWQWVQRATLSTALGAYLFSIIAASGD